VSPHFSDDSDLHILVVGAGSAGKRHARNLRLLGCRISACDPRHDRLLEIEHEGPLVRTFATLDRALLADVYDGFIIASPPPYHVDQTLQVLDSQYKWVMCEKPLSTSAQDARRLKPHAGRVMVGYTYRWWPPIQTFRSMLRSGEIGAVRSMRFVMSAHLEDWHPWEKYQDFFMAHRAQGGGALLDESHFVDLMLWMLGLPSKVYAHVDKISSLEIDSDDNVDMLVSYPNNIRVNLHLDLIGRPHQRSITAVGEAGTLVYSYEENALRSSRLGEHAWTVEQFNCERNDMFLGAAKEFMLLIHGEDEHVSCSVEDGIAALVVVDACRHSARTGSSVSLD